MGMQNTTNLPKRLSRTSIRDELPPARRRLKRAPGRRRLLAILSFLLPLLLALTGCASAAESRFTEQCRQSCMTEQNQCMLLSRSERDIQQCKRTLQSCSEACGERNGSLSTEESAVLCEKFGSPPWVSVSRNSLHREMQDSQPIWP